MKRATRIVLHIVLPPFVGGVLMTAPAVFFDSNNALEAAFVFVVYGYVFAGVPSLLYAWAMEIAFAKGVTPGSGNAIAASTALGASAGLVIVLGLSALGGSWPHGYALLMFIAVGLAVGAAVEGIIAAAERWLRRAKRSGPISGP